MRAISFGTHHLRGHPCLLYLKFMGSVPSNVFSLGWFSSQSIPMLWSPRNHQDWLAGQFRSLQLFRCSHLPTRSNGRCKLDRNSVQNSLKTQQLCVTKLNVTSFYEVFIKFKNWILESDTNSVDAMRGRKKRKGLLKKRALSAPRA